MKRAECVCCSAWRARSAQKAMCGDIRVAASKPPRHPELVEGCLLVGTQAPRMQGINFRKPCQQPQRMRIVQKNNSRISDVFLLFFSKSRYKIMRFHTYFAKKNVRIHT